MILKLTARQPFVQYKQEKIISWLTKYNPNFSPQGPTVTTLKFETTGGTAGVLETMRISQLVVLK